MPSMAMGVPAEPSISTSTARGERSVNPNERTRACGGASTKVPKMCSAERPGTTW